MRLMRDSLGILIVENSRQRSSWHDTRTVSRLGAPGDSSGLSIGDVAHRRNRSPNAEIIDRINHCELALRVGAFSSAVALGVAALGTAACVVFESSRCFRVRFLSTADS